MLLTGFVVCTVASTIVNVVSGEAISGVITVTEVVVVILVVVVSKVVVCVVEGISVVSTSSSCIGSVIRVVVVVSGVVMVVVISVGCKSSFCRIGSNGKNIFSALVGYDLYSHRPY